MASKRATDDDALVAQRIRVHRQRAGLSQTELGRRLGVTFQQVQKYEAATNRVGAGRLLQMARVFGVPIQALFPDDQKAGRPADAPTSDDARTADFVLSADGWRLCRAFLAIPDPKLRSTIVALVRELSHSDGAGSD